MGKVQVIYEDLKGSQTSLGSAGDALEKISTDIDQLSSSLESAGAGHDNCFGDISTLLDELNEIVISDWIEELNSIIASLAAVVAVFTDAEGKIISDLNKINEDALEQAIEGATGQDIPDNEKFDLDVYQNRKDYDNGTEYTGTNQEPAKVEEKEVTSEIPVTTIQPGTTSVVTGAITGNPITNPTSSSGEESKKEDEEKEDKDEEENVEDIDEDGKKGPEDENLNVDTDGDGKADLNIDTDGDGKADLNIDTDGDGKADLNIDSDGDGKADLNIDTDGDGKADLNIDTDGDGKADQNIDADGDGKVDTESNNNDERNVKEDDNTSEAAHKEPTVVLKQILADKPAAAVGTASAGVVSGGVSGNVAPTEPKEVKTEETKPEPVVEPEPEEPVVEPDPEEPVVEQPEEQTGTHQTIPIDTTTPTKKSSGTSVVPLIAGIAAAGAAGIGTKIYLDRKSNNDNDEEDQGDEEEYSYSGDYEVANNSESYLDSSDDIGYSAIKDADAALEENSVEPLEDAEEPKDTYKAVSFDDLSETH